MCARDERRSRRSQRAPLLHARTRGAVYLARRTFVAALGACARRVVCWCENYADALLCARAQQENALESLTTVDWSKMFSLTQLWLANNKLVDSGMPAVLPLSLLDVQLQSNRLTAVPSALLDLHNLMSLDLVRKGACACACCCCLFVCLFVVVVVVVVVVGVGWWILKIMGFFFSLRPLTTTQSDNAIKTLPNVIGHLTSLVSLDLTQNSLRRLPPSVAHLSSLHTLRLAKNKLEYLSPSVRGEFTFHICFVFLIHMKANC